MIARAFAAALHAIAFGAAFAAACWFIGRSLPFPAVPVISAKLGHLSIPDPVRDTLFIGSSRIAFQVLPEIFDATTSLAGLPTRSFNAGVPGMLPPEDGYLLEQILQRPQPGLRWVFVELASIRPDIDTLHMGAIRALYWRDWPRLLLVCRRVLDTPAMKEARTPSAFLSALQPPMTRAISSISLFAQRSSNIGRGSILTDRLLKSPDPQPGAASALGRRRDGWTPSERPEQMDAAERALFLTRLVERRAQPIRASRGDPASQDALARVVAAILKAGATPVLIVPPVTFHTYFDPNPETARQCIVLNFSDPSAYPDFFTEETHFDADHLNVKGSRLFTNALAEHFSDAVRQRRAR